MIESVSEEGEIEGKILFSGPLVGRPLGDVVQLQPQVVVNSVRVEDRTDRNHNLII